jgi:hypothetical protein
VINIDQALTWVTWAFFSGAVMGTLATVALALQFGLPLRRKRGGAA